MSAARAWLAQADDDPQHAERWWTSTGTVLLPAGRQWDAVRIPAGRGRTAFTAAAIPGPAVIAPADGYLYALVPVGTADTWDLPNAECLTTGAYITVPAPEQVTPDRDGRLPYWLQPPLGTGQLVDPVLLRSALTADDVAADR